MISFSYIREKKVSKFIAAFMALNLLSQIIMPTVALALTNGPSQAETQSFEPAGTSDMVDLFTGDFNYNIPLFDLPGSNGGYPFNLAYHSGVGMDEEASWVGLGWNVNPGAINRDKRGLPDEFNGDEVKVSLDREPNVTWGILTGFNTEVAGGNIGKFGAGGVLNIYSNNFKGIGYTIGTSTSYTSETSSMGFGIQLDSQEGVGANTNLSLGKNMQSSNPTYAGVGVGYNSQRGLTLSVYGRLSAKAKEKEGGRKKTIKGFGIGGSSSYTFAERSFTPSFGPAVTGSNLQIKIQIGGSAAAVQYTGSIGGFYRTESLQDKEKTYAAYGYNYLEGAGTDGMMDFNREKDGTVRKETPNLASPVLTYDTYVATGQGFAGNYRAHRNDIGHLHDPYTESKIQGWSFGVDIGLGYDFQIGAEGSKNSTVMTSGDWGNGLSDLYTYKDGTEYSVPVFEKLYYRMKGDLSTFDANELDYIGGEAAARGWLLKEDDHYILEADRLQPSYGDEVNGLKSRRERNLDNVPRIQRNNSIQPITNGELMDNTSSNELLKEYDISFYNNPNPQLNSSYHFVGASLTKLDRKSNAKYKSSHNAGFTCVNTDGLRYVYALPAYNNSEEEIAFTYDGQGFNENSNYISNTGAVNNYQLANSEKFKSITQTPGYAHSHLLTSVLGADYIDVTGNGISDDDYGYWVKFNYVKTTDQYKWRAPYEGAIYLRGTNTTLVDDKAMFNYGEKELWYLATAETKTHIAIFDMSQRKDGNGAGTRYSTESQTVKPSFKLDKIYLFSKANYNQTTVPIVPLKTVHFDYTYDLCPNVKNNLASEMGDNVKKGKLTLKSVRFSYQNNTRGSLSPYTFDYNELVPAENPSYNPANDNTNAWGGYRGNDDFYKQINLPYVTQFDPASTASAFKAKVDQQAAVWNLKKIGLPTGGSITINYESDDYAYVQHRRATQMFKIVRMSDETQPGKVYAIGGGDLDNEHRRVYFRLETPISTSDPVAAKNKVFTDYVSQLRQDDGTYPLYYRIRSDLRDGLYETVAGYCDLNDDDMCGVSDLSSEKSGGNYLVGYITLKPTPNADAKYHPFSLAGWQYLRINMPHLLTAFGKIGGGTQGSSDKDKAIKIASLGSVIPAIKQLFSYRQYAYKKSWARMLDTDKSFIRLTTPDQVKYGGGLRVKQIAFTDNWDASSSNEHSNTYGQTYDYTITENGETFSSGVAQYEPMAAGDEIALRHPRNYTDNIPLKTDNNLYFEYPVNESLYPGASVGYRKVTTQSIASKTAAAGVSTTGITEYKFYTSREYPVITDETDNHVRYRNYYIPIPLVGEIVQNKLHATQGYAIMLNDMNGKLESITNYAKSTDGSKAPAVVSSIKYEYKHTTRLLDGQLVNVVDNKVPAIVNETVNSSNKIMHCNKKDVIVGEEYDFFTDSRSSNIYSTQFGGAVDLLIFTPFAAIPTVWPAGSVNESDLKLFVTNKIISKSGILIKTVSTDGQATITTENKLFDAQTGSPLLTTVTNDFDNPVYTYLHPANWEHDGMGAAAKNVGFKFYVKVKGVDPTAKTFTIQNEYSTLTPALATAVTKNEHGSTNAYPIDKDAFQKIIAPGDEVIIQKNGDSHKYPGTLLNSVKASACYPFGSNDITYHCDAGLSVDQGDELCFTIVRSGRRNLPETKAGNIVALKDPTDDVNRVPFVNIYPNTVCLADEVAALLNQLLSWDSDLSNGRQLPLITYAIPEGSYPVLGKLYEKIQISTSECSDIAPGFVASAMVTKYSLTFSYINESGNCVTIACDCFIPVYKHGSTTEFLDFTKFEAIGDCKVKGITTNADNFPKIEGSLYCLSPNLDKTYTGIKDVISGTATVFSGASDYIGYTSPDPVNEYRNGKKGIWKSFVNYYYKDERINQKLADGNVKLSTDGVYKGDNLTDLSQHEFYAFNWKPTLAVPIPYKWVAASANTAYDGNSNVAETKDVTNISSAMLYENSGLPIMAAKNAKRRELYNENFEEAVATRYLLSGTIAVNRTLAHTGKSSLLSGSGDLMYLSYFSPVNSLVTNLIPGKYVISMWMSKNTQPVTYVNGENVGIKIVYYDRFSSIIGTSDLIKPSGNVIEKWQRIEGTFTPPLGTSTVAIKFNLESGVNAYFDDIRILPFHASVRTSVYDPVNYRLVAELDENNFATMYSYDGEGKQFLTKKETTAGIKSIVETRGHLKE